MNRVLSLDEAYVRMALGVEPHCQVGDIVQLHGSGMTPGHDGKYFKVEAVGRDGLPTQVSPPYVDQACTVPFVAAEGSNG